MKGEYLKYFLSFSNDVLRLQQLEKLLAEKDAELAAKDKKLEKKSRLVKEQAAELSQLRQLKLGAPAIVASGPTPGPSSQADSEPVIEL